MSDDQKKEDRQVKFVFQYDPNYRLIACNGVWGGVTSRGDFRLEFMVESQAIPDYVINTINEEAGEIGKEIERVPGKHFVRQLQVGIIMSPDNVAIFAAWLMNKLNEIQRIADEANQKLKSKTDNQELEDITQIKLPESEA